MSAVINLLSRILPVLLLIVLIVNMMQKGLTTSTHQSEIRTKNLTDQKKRSATLIIAGLILSTWISTLLLQSSQYLQFTGIILIALTTIALFKLRKRIMVFSLYCRFCGARLPVDIILGTNRTATITYEKRCCPSPTCTDQEPPYSRQ